LLLHLLAAWSCREALLLASPSASRPPSRPQVSVLPSHLAILHMILVAIVAFLVGHYT
jgi:hypothetical protein